VSRSTCAISTRRQANCIAGLVDHLETMNRSTKPRMPPIKNLAPLANVGVLAFSCTTSSSRNQPWAASHPCGR
jgi:hypothetical protein